MSIADKYQVVQSTKTSQISSILLATLIIVLFAAPYWAGSGDLRLLSEVFLYPVPETVWQKSSGRRRNQYLFGNEERFRGSYWKIFSQA